MRPHFESYHEFSADEIISIRSKLTQWYSRNRRKLPWRGDVAPFGAPSNKQNNNDTSNPRKKRKTHNSIQFYFKPQSKQTCTDTKHAPKDIKEDCVKQAVKVTAYHTWISEVMLQQTKVETVISYYLKWMEAFPTIQDLAKATLDEVNASWAGLGYYRRAQYLHEASRQIIKEFNGELPRDLKQLKSIKGVGDYTAGAISSIAFNECNAAVDGNLVRVLSRLRAIACKASPPLKIHWKLAGDLVKSVDNPGIMNQALMELGATVCIPTSPKCEQCPISAFCKALHEVRHRQSIRCMDDKQCSICQEFEIEDIEQLTVNCFPMKKTKNKVRQQTVASAILIVDDQVLMIKRPSNGLLAHQWEYPMVILHETDPQREAKTANTKQISTPKCEMYEKLIQRVNMLYFKSEDEEKIKEVVREFEYVGSSVHIFSHIRQTCHVFRVHLQSEHIDVNKKLIYDGDYEWYSLQAMNKKKLTVCVKKQWLLHVNFDKSLLPQLKPKYAGKKRDRQTMESN